jgi:hypothetical protein
MENGLLSGTVELDVKFDDMSLVKLGIMILVILLFAFILRKL